MIHDYEFYNQSIILDDLIKYAESTGASFFTAHEALRNAVEKATYSKFKYTHIIYDSEKLSVQLDFLVPEQIGYEKAKLIDPNYSNSCWVSKKLLIKDLPDDVILLTKKLFLKFLDKYQKDEIIERWKENLHTAMDGEILSVQNDKVVIQIGMEQAIMEKKDFVPSEMKNNYYMRGNILKFYVSRIKYKPLQIFVSRSSKSLPQKILKQKYPHFKFECTKRSSGIISIIYSNAPYKTIRTFVKSVEKELNNEKIVIVPYN